MTVEKRFWGTCGGREVFLFDLRGESGTCVSVSNYGGIIQSFLTKDRFGKTIDVVLGYDTLEEYREGSQFFGAAIGPVADRLVCGSCELAGRKVSLPCNAGRDCMHSGPNGFHAAVWDWEIVDEGLELSRRFTEEGCGFPGDLDVKIRYSLEQPDSLRIDYCGRCSQETAASFTNHSYFNLDGGTGGCLDQTLCVCGSCFAQTEGEEDPVCTGQTVQTEGTPMDLRRPRTVASVLAATDYEELRTAGGLDHYFLVDGEGMRRHAWVESEKSGLRLNCWSDAPGVLVYTANGLDREVGKNRQIYEKHWGVCLETERFPNGVNFPHLREQVLLHAGEEFRTCTIFEIVKL